MEDATKATARQQQKIYIESIQTPNRTGHNVKVYPHLRPKHKPR
jgi:hypothetical protein